MDSGDTTASSPPNEPSSSFLTAASPSLIQHTENPAAPTNESSLARAAAPLKAEKAIGSAEEKNVNYYRGFYAAERRREPVNRVDELSFMELLVGHTVALIPFALLWVGGLWVVGRAKRGAPQAAAAAAQRAAAASRGGSTATPPHTASSPSFSEEFKKILQNAMTPLAPRDFRVHVKGTRFKDVLGVPEAVEQVRQYVDFLREPDRFTRLGGRLPKGCLLSGPPGTGKTLLAKAVAGESDVPFFSCNGSDFMELYVGSGPKRVRELFDAARRDAPCVVFIDELDAVGSRSRSGGTGIDAEESRTINQLLAELDGLQPSEAVIVFGATNFKENIDKALLRDGRFDRKVELSLPDQSGRHEIFCHYLKRIKLAKPTDDSLEDAESGSPATDLQRKESLHETAEHSTVHRYESPEVVVAAELAALTPGIAPATISTIVNEAAIQAAVAGHTAVPASFLVPTIDDVLLGKKQSWLLREEDKQQGPCAHNAKMRVSKLTRSAWHESGHTLLAWAMRPHQTPVLKVSIIPRHTSHYQGEDGGTMATNAQQGIFVNNLGGYTKLLGREALDMPTQLRLLTDVCVLLAGREAESILSSSAGPHGEEDNKKKEKMKVDLYGQCSVGAQQDYQLATQKVLELFTSFGMPPLQLRVLKRMATTADDGTAISSSAEKGSGYIVTDVDSKDLHVDNPLPLNFLPSHEPQRLRAGRMHQKQSPHMQAVVEGAAQRYLEQATFLVREHLLFYLQELKELAAQLHSRRELSQSDVATALQAVPPTGLLLEEALSSDQASRTETSLIPSWIDVGIRAETSSFVATGSRVIVRLAREEAIRSTSRLTAAGAEPV